MKIMNKMKHQIYSEEQIIKAIADIEKGISIRKVASLHKISRTTLQRKLKDGTHLATKRGPRTLFSEDQENIIVMWIKTMATAGFPVTKETLMYSVENLAKECKVTFPGGNTLPGRKWYEAFLRRHPDITVQTSQNLSNGRLDVTQENIDKWFSEVDNYLKLNKLEEILNYPKRVFNCDETSFFLNHKPETAIAEIEEKIICSAAESDDELNLTVLLTVNAAGELAPPMIVHKHTSIPQQLVEATDWCIAKSVNERMTQETFYEYLTNIFEPYLTKQKIQRPVILFMDGHSSHISLPLSTFCIQHGIEMVALFPNASHLLQPLDVAVFHTLKNNWRQEVAKFRMNNDGQHLQKCDFSHVLKAALQHVTPETIVDGFNTCGLVPWNPQKVTVERKLIIEEKTMPTQKRHREMVTFFKILEEKIGKNKLIAFRANHGEWSGPTEQSDLYKLWVETKETLNSQLHLLNIEPHSQLAAVNYFEEDANETSITNGQESHVYIDNPCIEDSFSVPLNSFEPIPGLSNGVIKEELFLPEDSFMETLNTYKPSAGPSNELTPFKRDLLKPKDKNSKVKRRRRTQAKFS